ncbi:hypothetical protein F5Y16DRAFT_139506 [Xylariaceae sp. FL0255]|nr:hypothetical protein F5Y16DRAFT_139506 [Xylariaceae sp. FL0255]
MSSTRDLINRFEAMKQRPTPDMKAKRTPLTGDNRVPLRERISRMRGSQGTSLVPDPIRPGTPIPMAGVTPPRRTPSPRIPLPPTPECPPAPRKAEAAVSDFPVSTDDIFFDRLGSPSRSSSPSPSSRGHTPFRKSFAAGQVSSRDVVPAIPSPLRQSYSSLSSEDLDEVDEKLFMHLRESVDLNAVNEKLLKEATEAVGETESPDFLAAVNQKLLEQSSEATDVTEEAEVMAESDAPRSVPTEEA